MLDDILDPECFDEKQAYLCNKELFDCASDKICVDLATGQTGLAIHDRPMRNEYEINRMLEMVEVIAESKQPSNFETHIPQIATYNGNIEAKMNYAKSILGNPLSTKKAIQSSNTLISRVIPLDFVNPLSEKNFTVDSYSDINSAMTLLWTLLYVSDIDKEV